MGVIRIGTVPAGTTTTGWFKVTPSADTFSILVQNEAGISVTLEGINTLQEATTPTVLEFISESTAKTVPSVNYVRASFDNAGPAEPFVSVTTNRILDAI